jgi:hypothetical protein
MGFRPRTSPKGLDDRFHCEILNRENLRFDRILNGGTGRFDRTLNARDCKIYDVEF